MTNLALKFLLELAGFAALAYTGAAVGSGLWAVVLAVTLPVVAIAVGRVGTRPVRHTGLPIGTRIPLELTVFVTAALGLLVTGAVVWAVAYLALVVINAALLTVLRQWEA